MPARGWSRGILVRSQVGGDFERPDAEIVALIAQGDVTVLSELVGAMYTMDGSLRSLSVPAVAVCGVAITAKCPPGDNQAMVRAPGRGLRRRRACR